MSVAGHDRAFTLPTCEHFWVSRHQPDFPPPISFVRVCGLCGEIDSDDLAHELAPLIEANRWLDAMVTTITAERDTAMALVEQPEADRWCREENCEWRNWRSGSMPTHVRGRDCPPVVI